MQCLSISGTGKLKQRCVEKSCPIQEKLKQELKASKSNITNKPVHDPNTKKAQGTSKAPKTKSEKQMGESDPLLIKAPSKEFQCPYCKSKFAGKYGKSSLKKHVKLRHEEQFEITDFSLISDNQKSSNENDAKMDESPKTLTEFDKFIKKRKSTESLGNTKKTPRTSEAKKSKSKKQIEPSDDPLDLLDDLEKDEVGPEEDEVTLLSTGSGNKIEKPAVALIQVFGEDDL